MKTLAGITTQHCVQARTVSLKPAPQKFGRRYWLLDVGIAFLFSVSKISELQIVILPSAPRLLFKEAKGTEIVLGIRSRTTSIIISHTQR